MKTIFKIVLTMNAMMLLVVVYAVKEHVTIPISIIKNEHISYMIYVVGLIMFSGICLAITRMLRKDTIEGGIEEVEVANNSYLPTYLGYFFIALGVNDISTLVWVFMIIFAFTYFSQSLYFNPMFLLFGYKFYYVTTAKGMKLFVISKKNIKTIDGIVFKEIGRINDYTFIDWRKSK